MKKILSELKKTGIEARTISTEHIAELKQELDYLVATNPMIKENIGGSLGRLDYDLTNKGFQAKSVLVIGVPDKITQVYFNYQGKKHTFILPPTYLYNTSFPLEKTHPGIMEVNRRLVEAFGAEGFQVEKMNLPCKLMAARSGLAKYGRNNIAYINGESSFNWIAVYISDMPVEEDSWQVVETMEACQNCKLCVENCPTQTIPMNQHLIHVEKCITLHNESSDEFPSWLKKSDHNAILGCIRCQEICPKNKSKLEDKRIGEEFSEVETDLILSTKVLENLPKELQAKLERVNLAADYEIIPRNLTALFQK